MWSINIYSWFVFWHYCTIQYKRTKQKNMLKNSFIVEFLQAGLSRGPESLLFPHQHLSGLKKHLDMWSSISCFMSVHICHRLPGETSLLLTLFPLSSKQPLSASSCEAIPCKLTLQRSFFSFLCEAALMWKLILHHATLFFHFLQMFCTAPVYKEWIQTQAGCSTLSMCPW